MDDRSYRATAEVLHGVMKLLHIVACQRNKACFYEARLTAYKAKNLPRFMVFAPNLGKKNGASDRNRTGDNHVGNVMLYQLSYTRIESKFRNGASDRNRTGDNHVGNVMLYQLSYTRISFAVL